MKKTAWIIVFYFSSLYSSENINFGKYTNNTSLFFEQNVQKISKEFLDTKYVSDTLSSGSSKKTKERLIINFEALDCFTFIDTVHALSISQNAKEFKQNLIQTRYKGGQISYINRNHFFSDWLRNDDIEDITCSLGQCITVLKNLNKNEKYLEKIPSVKRNISYVSSNDIDISLLKNGDYVGIYTDKKGLDVIHTGIIIKKDGNVFIRHASSLEKKVIDSDFIKYIKEKSGVIVYRSNKQNKNDF